jgi:hypothetical protein
MKRKQYVTISTLTILLASIFFADNSQFLKSFAQRDSTIDNGVANPERIASQVSNLTSPSMNNAIGKRSATPVLTSSNLTATLGVTMNPKALLASAVDQIRNSTTKIIGGDNQTAATIFVRNPRMMLLSHQIIPPKGFILFYDAIGYKIVKGQMYGKLPCDSNSKSPLQILIGRLSELKPAQLQLITGLSKPGYTCMYYVHLTSSNNITAVITNAVTKEAKMHSIMTSEEGLRGDNLTITDIELLNPTNYQVILPDTASLAISVKQIKPLEQFRLHQPRG